MKINVMTDILEADNRIATVNQGTFDQHSILVINLMSSPGSGKTTLLERTAEALMGKLRLGVITGDIATTIDSERLEGFKLPVIQLTTGSPCHLDANMIASALPHLDLNQIDILIIENVGNLVCPAEFDTGAVRNAMILSVPEGDDKPLKYPLMFTVCDALLVNKMDYLEFSDFDLQAMRDRVLRLNPEIRIFEISAKTGQGVEEWAAWLSGETRSFVA